VAKLLANLMTFLLHMSPTDARHSALFIQLQALQLELTKPHNKHCLDQLKGPGTKPRVAHAFVEAIQSILAEYAAFATNNMALRAALEVLGNSSTVFLDPNIDSIHHQMLDTKVLAC
jgi:hypothetical protein